MLHDQKEQKEQHTMLCLNMPKTEGRKDIDLAEIVLGEVIATDTT